MSSVVTRPLLLQTRWPPIAPARSASAQRQQFDHQRRTTTVPRRSTTPTPAPPPRQRPLLLLPPSATGSGSSRVERLPQNTENPLALPTPALSPLEAVAAQLDALAAEALDRPWPLHGVGVAYAFCADSGSLEMSRYFAPMSASLYHQDHFQGKFLTRLPSLVGHEGWRVEEEEPEDGEGVAAVRVSVAPSSASPSSSSSPSSSPSSSTGGEGGRHTYVFVMVRQEAGLRKGSWVTKQLVRLGPDGSVV